MTYENTKELLEILKKHNIWTNKKLGQNFLVNTEVLNKIIAAADLKPDDYVVEVGPGLGILTAELSQKASHVLAVELDSRLIPILNDKFKNTPAVEIMHADALKLSLPEHRYKVIANIPYYITSPLLNHFLQPTPQPTPQAKTQKRPDLLVLLVQKEVAEKICVGAGDHTILSLQVQIFGKPVMVSTVDKSSFFPQPKVDSAILKVVTYPSPLIQNTDLFFKIVKTAFSKRRKTLQNSLKNCLGHGKEEIDAILQKAGIDPKRRPQDLDINEWNKLVNCF